MVEITELRKDLKVKEVKAKNRTRIYVIDGDKEVLLSSIATDEYFWLRWAADDNYIVAYSRGCMVNQIPLTVEAAYNVKEKKVVDVSNKRIRDLLEYMLICQKGFNLAKVLSEINSNDLGLLKEEEKGDLARYLTLGNKKISHEDVVNYILKLYPQLQRYTELKDKLTVVEYRKIEEDFEDISFWFHPISQQLSDIPEPEDGKSPLQM